MTILEDRGLFWWNKQVVPKEQFAPNDCVHGKLTISDDGVGLPPKIPAGMGLRTMAYRASVIGAAFKLERQLSCGTRVTCTLPPGAFLFETHD